MRRFLLFSATTTLLTMLSGCATYTFQSVYPSYYPENFRNARGQLPSEGIPGDLLQALPQKFQLAHYTGHLWCFQDWQGQLQIFKLNKSFQRTQWSETFLRELQKARNDNDFRVFTPVGYPHVYCVMPNVDVQTLFDETWFSWWLVYLAQWESSEIENEVLSKSNEKLILETEDTKKEIATINDLINSYETRIREKKDAINAIDAVIKDRKAQLEGNTISFFSGLSKEVELPPFDSRIPYDRKKDPFQGVIKDHTKDISDKTWAGNGMEGGKYIDPELADKIQEVNDAFADPEKIKDTELKREVNELKEKGFNSVTLNSGARTPWRQAVLYSKAKKGGTPVGKYVGSDHMFGQAGDMVIPKGWSWTSNNHKQLRSVMKKFGLIMKVQNDPVHFTLANQSSSFLARRLAMVRAYHARAQQIKAAQGAVKENAIFEQGRITEQKAKLEADLLSRKNDLNNKADIFTRVSAAYIAKQEELEQLDAEIARGDEEKRKAEENKRKAEEDKRKAEEDKRKASDQKMPEPSREPRGSDHWDRPRPEPPSHEPPAQEPPAQEPPSHEPPAQEPSSREPPPEREPAEPGRLP